MVDVAKNAHLTDPALLNNESDEIVATTIIGEADVVITVWSGPDGGDDFYAANDSQSRTKSLLIE